MEDIRLTGTSFVHETAQTSAILSAPHTLANCTLHEIICATSHNSLVPGQLKGIMQAPPVMACHVPQLSLGSLSPAARCSWAAQSTGVWRVCAWLLHSRSGSCTLLCCKQLICEGKFSDLPGCTKRLWCGHWPHSPTTEDTSAGTRSQVTDS